MILFQFPSPPFSTLYDPPIPEFSVIQVKLRSGGKECHDEIRGPSIAIVTEGKGKVSWGLESETLNIGLGDVFFVDAGNQVGGEWCWRISYLSCVC